MRWVFGGVLMLIGVGMVIAGMRNLKEIRENKKENEDLNELRRLNKEVDNDLVEVLDMIEKQYEHELELRKQLDELTKQLVDIVKKESPNVVIL